MLQQGNTKINQGERRSIAGNTQAEKVKLPTINLPRFDGTFSQLLFTMVVQRYLSSFD